MGAPFTTLGETTLGPPGSGQTVFMGSGIGDLFSPRTPQTDPDAATPRVDRIVQSEGESQVMTAVTNVLDSLKQAAIEQATTLLRGTPIGQQIEQEATRQKIMDILRSPITIIVIIFALLGLGAVAGRLGR